MARRWDVYRTALNKNEWQIERKYDFIWERTKPKYRREVYTLKNAIDKLQKDLSRSSLD